MQRSGARQLGNFGVSESMSSSFPVLPTALGERYHKLPDSQQASMERELAQQSLVVISPMSSNSGVVVHLFSSSSGFSTASADCRSGFRPRLGSANSLSGVCHSLTDSLLGSTSILLRRLRRSASLLLQFFSDCRSTSYQG
ncbi:Uncharacterized protein Adt_33765 [Abeliophyllum distichum]|uniref:Uncharacterized protein n=1 Tax=Abeliophyllum distichum TaxID=126358 RepID=A0ABD1QX54_9LAMI